MQDTRVLLSHFLNESAVPQVMVVWHRKDEAHNICDRYR